jgi:hypothetical protein
MGSMSNGTTNRVQVGVTGDVPAQYSLTATATADGDTQPGNDAFTFVYTVLPNTDIALAAMRSDQHVRIGSAVDYTVSVTTASQPIQGATVMISGTGGITLLQATPAFGTCQLSGNSAQCTLGAMAANSSINVVVRVRGDNLGAYAVQASAAANGDVDKSNNAGTGTITVDQRGNVSLTAAGTALSGTTGSTVDLPRITVTALTPTDDVSVNLVVPASFSIDSATADGGACAVNAGSVRCTFGSMAGGTNHGVNLRLRANQAGNFTVTGSASAADDSDSSDNSISVSIAVAKSSAGNSGSSGGGGGGALDPATLILLLLAPAALLQRRRPR